MLQDAFLHICQPIAYALHSKMGDMLGEPYARLAEQKLIHMMTAGSEAEDPEAHQLSVRHPLICTQHSLLSLVQCLPHGFGLDKRWQSVA